MARENELSRGERLDCYVMRRCPDCSSSQGNTPLLSSPLAVLPLSQTARRVLRHCGFLIQSSTVKKNISKKSLIYVMCCCTPLCCVLLEAVLLSWQGGRQCFFFLFPACLSICGPIDYGSGHSALGVIDPASSLLSRWNGMAQPWRGPG